MPREKVLHILWYCGIKWVADIMHRTAGSAGYLHYHTSIEEVAGKTIDISEYLEFSFYDLCWYNDNNGLGDTKLGK